MTDIAKARHDEQQRANWRAQAVRSAAELKQVPSWGLLEEVKVGFAFDDSVVQLTIPTAHISSLSEAELALLIFDQVLNAPTVQRAAVPEAPPAGPDAAAIVAAAAEEACWRRLPPEFTQPCTNKATGGVKLKLFPHQSIQKRYGKKPMLELILDLPICSTCFPQMTPDEVIQKGMAPEQWGAISKAAQRRCNGILPMREESVIEPVPFDDPQYLQLRAHIAKQRAAAAAQHVPDVGKAANE